jgi:dienelactone hydrolase
MDFDLARLARTTAAGFLVAVTLAGASAAAAPSGERAGPAATSPPQMPKPQISDPGPQGVRIDEAGVFANYFAAPGPGKHPAIIVLGGSEGGLGTGSMRDAKALQAHGFNALQLAYFGAPGEPDELASVPLETFDRGLAWLKSRPEVDGSRIGLEGASKGSEAALLFASRSPDIKVVAVGMPSSVVWQGISFTPAARSSWMTGGQAIPFLPYVAGGGYGDIYGGFDRGLKALDSHPDAVIPAERINGSVMLVCGKADTLWPSCPMAEQMAARLKAKGFRHRVELLEYDDAGHGVFGPPVPRDDPKYPTLGSLGGSMDGNNAARGDSWPRLLALLDEALKP